MQHYPESCPDTFVHTHTQDAYVLSLSMRMATVRSHLLLAVAILLIHRDLSERCLYCQEDRHMFAGTAMLRSSMLFIGFGMIWTSSLHFLVLPGFLCEVMPLISPSHYLGDPQMLKP